ncbi:MAG: serine hydrolase domain-containing protein [Chthoniobacterales bacterium]
MQLDAAKLRGRIEPLFRENFDKFGELGAAISIWYSGKPIVDLHGGFCDAHREKAWTADTLVLIWSATKGLGSACVLHALQENRIDISQRVAEFWPEFAQAGKEKITFAQLLSHSAGLAALDRPADILDYAAVIEAIQVQTPNWPPGTAHGYHARTFGFLLDEIVRRIAGKTLPEYWHEVFAEPLELDLWIGLPEKESARVATMYAARAGKSPELKLRQSGRRLAGERSDFYVDIATPGTFARKVFTSPRGLNAVSAMNDPKTRAQPIVSFGGIGTANSLAKFYAMLASAGELEGQRLFSEKTLKWMAMTLADGMDRVFQIPTAFSAGFMRDSHANLTGLTGQVSARPIFGRSTSAFGHPGAGGSHAFADPENKVAFAYVMNQMEQTVLPNAKSLRLVDAIYDLL